MTFTSRDRPSRLSITSDLKDSLLTNERASSRSLVSQMQKELEDLKASTKRETQRVRNVKRKMELAEQKTDRLQNEQHRLVMKVASLTSDMKILRSQEENNEWLVATNNNLQAIVEKLTKRQT
ncbi:uncharacterized protein LOC134813384 [Bolinopsis microptera]|uniref:uncharacterized protein LOC134813384 n=1 Tax=Bolinopsis microptera TaxID=2820187 RepID=UPI00307B08FD